jgi:ACR3 family arsenite efflux pump ArsB
MEKLLTGVAILLLMLLIPVIIGLYGRIFKTDGDKSEKYLNYIMVIFAILTALALVFSGSNPNG